MAAALYYTHAHMHTRDYVGVSHALQTHARTHADKARSRNVRTINIMRRGTTGVCDVAVPLDARVFTAVKTHVRAFTRVEIYYTRIYDIT